MNPAAILVSLALFLGSTPAAAQTARLEGTVIDSLRGVPLAGARVRVGDDPRRFLCDRVGGNRSPVSDEIVVEPGDQVTLVIPAT
jgi:hypothetical protein